MDIILTLEQYEELFETLNRKKINLMKTIKELNDDYKKEKIAIEAKNTSATQLKQVFIKNNKIENKIFSKNETKEEKEKYYDELVKDYLSLIENKISTVREIYNDKMDREIEALENKIKEVKNKYEIKIQVEIKELNSKCKSYVEYLERQKAGAINKVENEIRDISSNIIVSNIGTVLDEEAYPKLTKLKFDITNNEKELESTIKELSVINVNILIAREKKRKYKQDEDKELEREAQIKKENEKQQQIMEYNVKKEKERKDEEERKRIKKEEKDKEQIKEQTKVSWKNSVYINLSPEYKRYSCYLNKEHSDKVQNIFNVQEVINYIDSILSEINNYISMSEHFQKEDNEVADQYFSLSVDQKFEISNKKDQMVQNYLIKKYYRELVEKQEAEKETLL